MAILAGVAVAVLLVAAHAQAEVAYNFPTLLVGNETDTQAHVLGNEFTVNSTISVTAVGAFDSGNGGFNSATVPVAIYSLSGTTWSKMNNTSESFSGTTGTLIGSARFQDLPSPVTLNPGTYAIVAANYGLGAAGTYALDWNVNRTYDPTTVPTFQTASSAITMGKNGNSSETAFFDFGNALGPTITEGFGFATPGNWGYPIPSFAAATFEFEPVPEAATFGAAGVGLLALVYIGRYARLRSKVTLA
jgi:hypothetical protein